MSNRTNDIDPPEPTHRGATSVLRWPVVLFDLDGTLWDSERGIIDCLVATFEELGHTPLSRAEFGSNVGPPLQEMLVECGIPRAEAETAVGIYRSHYRAHGESACEVFDGVSELLDELQSSGAVLATATSKGFEPTERMLDAFGLSTFFEAVGAASMDASRHHKIDVITHTLELLGQPDPSSIVMIGDRHYDIGGGKHFDLDTIGVSWGYANPGELEAAQPDHVATSMTELRNLLIPS